MPDFFVVFHVDATQFSSVVCIATYKIDSNLFSLLVVGYLRNSNSHRVLLNIALTTYRFRHDSSNAVF